MIGLLALACTSSLLVVGILAIIHPITILGGLLIYTGSGVLFMLGGTLMIVLARPKRAPLTSTLERLHIARETRTKGNDMELNLFAEGRQYMDDHAWILETLKDIEEFAKDNDLPILRARLSCVQKEWTSSGECPSRPRVANIIDCERTQTVRSR